MSNLPTNFREYFSEMEAEMGVLRAAVRTKDEDSRPQPPSSEASAIGNSPVMHFQGPVEPFTLSVSQLEVVRACRIEVQGFLRVKAGTSHPSRGQPELVDIAARPRRPKKRSSPIMPCLLYSL